MTRGQLTIVAIFGFSLVAVCASMVWRHLQTRQVLEFWGPQAAELIAKPERVEAWKLVVASRPTATSGRTVLPNVEVGDDKYLVLGQKDVTRAAGFTHARHALTLSSSFEFDGAVGCVPTWTYGLAFSREDQNATVLIDADCRLVYFVEGDRVAVIKTRIAEGLETVLREQLESGDNAAAADDAGVEDNAKSSGAAAKERTSDTTNGNTQNE